MNERGPRPDGASWFPADVEIRRVADGQTRTYRTWESADTVEFAYGDGNSACDCNRSLYFAYAAGGPYRPDATCGDGAYAVRIRDAETGAVVYEDQPSDNK